MTKTLFTIQYYMVQPAINAVAKVSTEIGQKLNSLNRSPFLKKFGFYPSVSDSIFENPMETCHLIVSLLFKSNPSPKDAPGRY